MVKIVQLEEGVAVAPQLTAADIGEIAALGFRALVNNRPDGEAADQLSSTEAEAAARQHGLAYRYQPVANARVTDDALVGAFADSLDDLPRPILFYCRSGTRCTLLWAQASVGRLGVARTAQIAAEGGYNVNVIGERLAELAEAARPDGA